MATPKWAPSTLYPNGSIVVPRTVVPGTPVAALTNPDLETGDATGWSLTAGMTISNANHYTGSWCIRCEGAAGELRAINEARATVPGMIMRGTCWYKQGRADAGQNIGYCTLTFYDAGMVQIGDEVRGSAVASGKDGAWHMSTVQAPAPQNAAFVSVGGLSVRTNSKFSAFDTFTLANVGGANNGLVYRAVQPDTGRSAGVEPVWPLALGLQVVDGEVIWEAIYGARVTYRARPILKSGAVEPAWQTELGSSTVDNTISWQLDSRRIDDENCPNSKVVVLDQNKIYAADDDIIPYCAVNNPHDWTTKNNAGYLPFGNGAYGSTPVSAMGLYRGRLMALNGEGMQDWQIDPDPALNQRLNSLPIGSTYHRSFAPFANDAMLLTAVGIRSMGLAAMTSNLAIGDAGAPVDTLVQACMYREGKPGLDPLGLYIPSAGQYWCIFVGDEARPSGAAGSYTDLPMVPWDDMSLVYVYAVSEVGKIGGWQRYYFPFPIHAATTAINEIGETVLAVRSGDDIIHIHERYLNDLMAPVGGGDVDGTGGDPIFARIQWAWLEMGGQIGQDKTVEAVDLVGDADALYPPMISMGWNQKLPDAFTTPYALPADTVPDEPVAFELTGPSISVRLEYNGGAWKFAVLNVYLQDRRPAR